MDTLGAFALACNVLTVVDFGTKTASLCRKAYKQKQPLPELAQNGRDFESATKSLKTTLETSLQQDPSAADQELLDVCQACQASATALLAELAKLNVSDGKGRWYEAVHSGFRAIWKIKSIKELHANLQAYERQLHQSVLINLRERFDLAEVKQQQGFSRLDGRTQALISQLARGKDEVIAAASKLHIDTREHISREVSSLKLENTRAYHSKQVLASLFFPEMNARLEEIPDSHAKTFEWIFEPELYSDDDLESGKILWDSYLTWLETGSGIYWFSGKPGAGKSTLMRFVNKDSRTQDALEKWSGNRRLLRTSFFIWNAGTNPLQKSTQGLLRTCLYGILSQRDDLTTIASAEDLKFMPQWTEQRLKQALLAVFQHNQPLTSFCIFLDGLDELEGDHFKALEIVQSLSRLDNVKICVSSRPYHVFERAFTAHPKLQVQNLTKRDISIFVRDKFTQLKQKEDITELYAWQMEELIGLASEKAEGVFLWVKLVINSLLEGLSNHDSYDELTRRLDEFPPELRDVYRHLYNRIPPQYKEEARRYLELLVSAQCSQGYGFTITILTFMLAEIRAGQLSGMMQQITEQKLINECRITRSRIRVCCGAFIEFGSATHDMFEPFSKSLDDSADVRSNEITEIKKQYALARFDTHHAVVQFPHRTARDFVIECEDISTNASENQRELAWDPLLSLAKAYIRRIEVLPWVFSLAKETKLIDAYLALDLLKQYEHTSGFSADVVVQSLCQAMQRRLARGQVTDGSESTISWTFFAGDIPFVNYEGIANDWCGISALWGLKRTVDKIIRENLADPTYLLECATNWGWSWRWGFEPRTVSSSLFKIVLGAGADANSIHSPNLQQQAQLTTPWRSTLALLCYARYRDWSTMTIGKTLVITKVYLHYGANPNELSIGDLMHFVLQVHLRDFQEPRIKPWFLFNVSMNVRSMLETFCSSPLYTVGTSLAQNARERQMFLNLQNMLDEKQIKASSRLVSRYKIHSSDGCVFEFSGHDRVLSLKPDSDDIDADLELYVNKLASNGDGASHGDAAKDEGSCVLRGRAISSGWSGHAFDAGSLLPLFLAHVSRDNPHVLHPDSLKLNEDGRKDLVDFWRNAIRAIGVEARFPALIGCNIESVYLGKNESWPFDTVFKVTQGERHLTEQECLAIMDQESPRWPKVEH